jgi:hypothetical protein
MIIVKYFFELLDMLKRIEDKLEEDYLKTFKKVKDEK